MKRTGMIVGVIAAALATMTTAAAQRLPSGHLVLAKASMTIGDPAKRFLIVASGTRRPAGPEERAVIPGTPRPLLVYEYKAGKPVLVARNDHVVLKADEGGQCDPFDPEDAGGRIATKGRYFTVENGVACGQHWTHFLTFRYDDRLGFVFDNERTESWRVNFDAGPNAEAMVREGRPRIVKADPRRPVRLKDWRPK